MCSRINCNKNSISFWLILFLCFICTRTISQYNLVPNYSFEVYSICPSFTSNPLPSPWYQPTGVNYQDGVYANGCATNPYLGVPYNTPGFQYAHSGQAYALIVTYSPIINSERYYLQTKLKDSLMQGKSYYAEFFVSLGDISTYSSNNISLLFSKTSKYVDTLVDPRGVIVENPQIINYGNPIIKDTQNWTKISGIFKHWEANSL